MPDAIFYEVTIEADASLAAAVENHMRHHHIPAILHTGCFERIRFDRAGPGNFRTCYQAASTVELDRYLHVYAPTLRLEFQEAFPAGVRLSRETWVQCQVWERR
jgi:Domain of unknown function (DUF4286)